MASRITIDGDEMDHCTPYDKGLREFLDEVMDNGVELGV